MEIIPAIDLKGGRCVRLLRGDYDQETVYSQEPVEMALHWQEQGAKRLHLVDLDGAKDGKPVNLDLVKQITTALDIPVQLGGGIRSMAIIDDYIQAGIDRLILGTIALQKPEVVKEAIEKYGPKKIIVGVDAKDGKVAVNGWLEESRKTVEEMIQDMKKLAVEIFIYTDISKDGTLSGPDLEGLEKYNQIEGIELIASGGVSSFEDLEELQKINISSVITGKALYTGDLSGDFEQLNKRLRMEG